MTVTMYDAVVTVVSSPAVLVERIGIPANESRATTVKVVRSSNVAFAAFGSMRTSVGLSAVMRRLPTIEIDVGGRLQRVVVKMRMPSIKSSC